MPEDEDVLVADFLADFDVGAVHGADGERAVEGELHVARAGGFGAGGGDLLGEIGGGKDTLGQRDAVVGQERDLEPIAHGRIIVDHSPTALMSRMMCLAMKYPGAALPPKITVRGVIDVVPFANAVIERDDVQQVQDLPLVFVNTLHLAVENGIGIDPDRRAAFLELLLDDFRQTFFAGELAFPPLALKRAIAWPERHELFELIQIGDPPVADGIGDELRQRRIAFEQPAALGDAVGLIVELLAATTRRNRGTARS